MRPDPAARETVLLALACTLWTATFLRDESLAALLAPPLVFAGLLVVRRHAVVTAAAVTLALAGTSILGVPTENPALLLPALVAVYAVGRHAAAPAGAAVVAALVTILVAADDLNLASGLFGSVLLGGTWTFGRLVRRRTEAARFARQEAELTERTDPLLVSAQVVAEERARLSREVVAVVRASVARMQELAADAEATLEPAIIDAISARGHGAVQELRRLLGLLRSDQPTAPPEPAPTGRRPPWVADVVTAAAISLLSVVELVTAPGGDDVTGIGVALTVLLPTSLALRRTSPFLGCLAAASTVSLSVLLGHPLHTGFSEMATVVLLSWSAAAALDRGSFAALGGLAGAEVFAAWGLDPANVPITLAILAVPAFAGYAWSERDREAQAAQAHSALLQNRLATEVDRAVTEERLRIARDIHDVSSHAVGVMVLHAGAARSQLSSDPESSRRALGIVVTAGTEALAELELLSEILRTGEPSRSSRPRPTSPEELARSLTQLAHRMRAGGLDVHLHLDRLPGTPERAALTYVVVQESLTNVAKHAPGASVDVLVHERPDALLISVHDDGGSRPHEVRATSGFGLTGLAERIRPHGGEVVAGPRDRGGFAVEARIPRDSPTLHAEHLDVSRGGS